MTAGAIATERLAPTTFPAVSAAVVEIEQHSFSKPWSMAMFERQLTLPYARVVVATLGGKLIGYSNYTIVVDEVELLSLATHPDWRGRGVAQVLLGELSGAGLAVGATRALLEVRAGNQPALGLYGKAGFAATLRRPGYYADGEDAICMAAPLPLRVALAG